MNQLAESVRRVRERVVSWGVDLDTAISDEFTAQSERSLRDGSPVPDSALLRRALVGLGDLQEYFDDDAVEEIWINNSRDVFVAVAGISRRVDVAVTPDEVRELVDRLLRPTGRRVDVSEPFVDATLPDGSRLHVAIPPVVHGGWSVNVRKFPHVPWTLAALVAEGSVSSAHATRLAGAVSAGRTLLVSGATQAGKTTLLSALASTVSDAERVVTVEETCELVIDVPDRVALQCRPASMEGTGEITLRRLVKEALRMRPTRLIVGEVRDSEALDLLIAVNSGLPGMCTIHANSAVDALNKLAMLPLLAGRNIDSSFVRPAVASAIDVVVHCRMSEDGRRRIDHIVDVVGLESDGAFEVTPWTA